MKKEYEIKLYERIQNDIENIYRYIQRNEVFESIEITDIEKINKSITNIVKMKSLKLKQQLRKKK